MPPIQLIAFDADDTLWHNETIYKAAKNRFIELIAPYADAEQAEQRLEDMEMRNIRYFGYGIKSFVLSMVETAVEISDGSIAAVDIRRIIEIGKFMLAFEMQVFDGVASTLAQLAPHYPLMIITKGDLMDQEDKLVRSGLANYFNFIEIVSQKNAATYQRILERYHIQPEGFLMIGNSLKSDILPVIEVGGRAIFVPYEHTWVHEKLVEGEIDPSRYYEVASIADLPVLIKQLSGAGQISD